MIVAEGESFLPLFTRGKAEYSNSKSGVFQQQKRSVLTAKAECSNSKTFFKMLENPCSTRLFGHFWRRAYVQDY